MNNLSEERDILLAEDDRDDVDIFKWAMQKTGISYQLRHAEDSTGLFVLLKEKVPYILFLDIQMPGKDGLSCILEIRKNRAYDKLPIIMYTSCSYSRYIEDAYRNGANLYLNKVAGTDDIVENLKKVFAVDWKNYLHYPTRDEFLMS